jgi:hypothetical protein
MRVAPKLRARRLLLEQPPLIEPRGSRIAVRLHDQPALLAFCFPRDSFSKPPEPRLVCWSSSLKFAAVALAGKSIGGIVAGKESIDFWGMPHFHWSGWSQGLLEPPAGDEWLPFIWLTNPSSRQRQKNKERPLNFRQRAVVIDTSRNLLSWISPGDRQWITPDPIDSNVLALSYVDSTSFAYLRVRGIRLEIILWMPDRTVKLDSVAMPTLPSKGYLSGQVINSQWHGAWCALGSVVSPYCDPNVWIYREAGCNSRGLTTFEIYVPPGCEPIGMFYDSTLSRSRYSLLAISPDRRHLLSLGSSHSKTVFTSISEIASTSISTDSDLIALLTKTEDLVVLRGNGQELFRWNQAKK